MKLYTARVSVTRWIDVRIVAESAKAAEALAFDEADSWMDDCSPDEETEVEVNESLPGDWDSGELPYLTDEAADAEVDVCGAEEADCDTWHDALKVAEPVVDTRTVPLALRYEDGRTERVDGVPQTKAAAS